MDTRHDFPLYGVRDIPSNASLVFKMNKIDGSTVKCKCGHDGWWGSVSWLMCRLCFRVFRWGGDYDAE